MRRGQDEKEVKENGCKGEKKEKEGKRNKKVSEEEIRKEGKERR